MRHHRRIHAAALGSPLVKRCGADAWLPVNIGHSKSSLNALNRVHDLAVIEFWLPHVEPLPLEKILLLTPLVLRGDYRVEGARDSNALNWKPYDQLESPSS
jgi:hypothetical protein